MAATPNQAYSVLYHRLRVSRAMIPLTASIGVFFFEVFEHGVPFRPIGWTPIVDVLVFGISGPAATFAVLTWLLHRVKERDEAEARLAVASAHERELLSQLEQSVRAERFGLDPTLQSILAAIGAETSITGGALYLLNQKGVKSLSPTVSWPSPETGVLLAQAAEASMARAGASTSDGDGSGIGEVAGFGPDQRILSVPITDRGEQLGFLILAGSVSDAPPDRRVLGVIASATALLVRNNQLYTRLQSQAVIDERNELAREVHDSLAQSLSFLNFKAQQVKRLLDRGDIKEASTAVDELCEGSREVYEEVRVLIRSLRSSADVIGGLANSLQQYSALVARRTGLNITVDAEAEPELQPDVQLQLFRVVQEALANVQKHAMARHVSIRLRSDEAGVTLVVEDDGVGLPARGTGVGAADPDSETLATPTAVGPDGHFGLPIMSERLQSVGGVLRVEGRPGGGTIVRIQVPVRAAFRGKVATQGAR